MPTGAYQSVAGVGQQGRARIRNKGHTFALAQQAQHRILALLFIVVKKTQHPARGKAALAKQGGGAAGVFGQYQVGLGQHGRALGERSPGLPRGVATIQRRGADKGMGAVLQVEVRALAQGADKSKRQGWSQASWAVSQAAAAR